MCTPRSDIAHCLVRSRAWLQTVKVISANDLQYFLAVAHAKRLVLAATKLGVDHTTVGRRIGMLESAIGERLFDRTNDGWLLTESGQRLLGPAEAVSAALATVDETLGQHDSKLSGTVRVLCPEGFGAFLLAPALLSLNEAHPDLVVEVVTETAHLGQTVRDFDVAVNLEELISPRIYQRRLSNYILRLYATPAYISSHPPVESLSDLSSHVLIWYVDRLLQVSSMNVLQQLGIGVANIQSTNVIAHWQAAAAGIGIAPLPQYLARGDSRLVEVLPSFEIQRTYWLAVPRELVRLSRVRLVIELLDRLVHERAADLLG